MPSALLQFFLSEEADLPRAVAVNTNFKVFVHFFKKNLRESERESFDQTFSKVCGFQRQRLWPFSAENGIPDEPKTQAGEPKQSSELFWRGGTLVRGTPVPW